jgi:hypothetical protein
MGGPQGFIGCIDNPGPVAAAGRAITVRGWVAGPEAIRDVRISIGDDMVSRVAEREKRLDLSPLGYNHDCIFAYILKGASLPDGVAGMSFVTITATLRTGETFRYMQRLYVAESIGDALVVLANDPGASVWAYINLATDCLASFKPYDAQQVIEAAKTRFPDDEILANAVRSGHLNTVHGHIDRPFLVSLAGTTIGVEGWVIGTKHVRRIEVMINGHVAGTLTSGFFLRKDLIRDPYLDAYEDEHKRGYRISDIQLSRAVQGTVLISCVITFDGGQKHTFVKETHVAQCLEDAITLLDERASTNSWAYISLADELIASGRDREVTSLLATAAHKFPTDANIKSLAYTARLARLENEKLTPELVDARRDINLVQNDDDASDVIGSFESLGFNCEFGFVQRNFDSEPLGLLRFSGTTFDQLIEGLKTEFAGVGELQYTKLFPAWNNTEYCLADTRLGFNSHTFIKPVSGEVEYAKIYRNQCRRLIFLKKKLIEDLRNAEKICLYYNYDRVGDEQIEELFRNLSRYGANSLFCVRPVEEGSPAGTVRLVHERLAIGYIDSFSKPENVPSHISHRCWLKLCRNALRLLRGAMVNSEAIPFISKGTKSP